MKSLGKACSIYYPSQSNRWIFSCSNSKSHQALFFCLYCKIYRENCEWVHWKFIKTALHIFSIDFFTYPKVRPNKDGLSHTSTKRLSVVFRLLRKFFKTQLEIENSSNRKKNHSNRLKNFLSSDSLAVRQNVEVLSIQLFKKSPCFG